MRETTPANNDEAFWGIVVAHAAADPKIKSTVRWLVVSDLKGVPIAADFYKDMEAHLLEGYGISPERCDQVFNVCENNLIEQEVFHGEA